MQANVRLRGYVDDEDVMDLPEHRRDVGYVEWILAPSPPMWEWPEQGFQLVSFDAEGPADARYRLELSLFRTDASGTIVEEAVVGRSWTSHRQLRSSRTCRSTTRTRLEPSRVEWC